ncbi:hypothetical protein [Streptomyces humi]|nr:hypothetical protein [Streptomyces humi]
MRSSGVVASRAVVCGPATAMARGPDVDAAAGVFQSGFRARSLW